MHTDIYTWREPEFGTTDLTGFKVEATDGSIGKVDDVTTETGFNCLVVDTGPWILGKKVVLPAGVIQSIDHEDGKIYVDRTKDEIKDAPEFDEDRFRDETYRSDLGRHYSTRMPERTTPRV